MKKRLVLPAIIALICLALLPVGRLDAQYLEVLAELDTNQVRIGEVFHLNLSVEQPAGLNIAAALSISRSTFFCSHKNQTA